MTKLSESALKAIAANPSEFFGDSKNRELALGMPVNDLKAQLEEFTAGTDFDPKALIKSVITEIEL